MFSYQIINLMDIPKDYLNILSFTIPTRHNLTLEQTQNGFAFGSPLKTLHFLWYRFKLLIRSRLDACWIRLWSASCQLSRLVPPLSPDLWVDIWNWNSNSLYSSAIALGSIRFIHKSIVSNICTSVVLDFIFVYNERKML